MNWISKHTCTVESLLNRTCLYCIPLNKGERLLQFFKELYDTVDGSGTVPGSPYKNWLFTPEQLALDQEIADALFTAITRCQDKKAEVISPWFTYRQLQRCANLIWDYWAVAPFPGDVKQQDTEIYKSLVDCMLGLAYDGSHQDNGNAPIL